MTKAEIKKKIEDKKNEIERYKSYQYFKFGFLTLISILSFVLCIIVGIVMCVFLFKYNNAIFITGSTFSFIFAGIIFVFYMFALIFYMIKKSRAPYAIEKLTEEIENLEKELENYNYIINNSKNINSDKQNDINLLLKYKELLDSNVITQEEYEVLKRKIIEK